MRADLIDSCSLQAFRLRLGLAQDEMAALLAVVAWECLGERAEPNGNMVSKWERGVKAPGRLYRNCYRILQASTLEQLATYISALACGTVEGMNRRQVLEVAFALGAAALLPDQLLSAPDGQVPDLPEVAALGGALLRYDASPTQRAGELESCGLNTLGTDLDRAWNAFQDSRYTTLNGMLPGLLAMCQAAVRDHVGDQRLHALALLSQAYQLAAFDLTKRGEGQFALLAADRGMLAAEQAEDPLAMAGCARVLAAALLSAGQPAKAKELCVSLAAPFQGEVGTSSPAQLSVYGSLVLKAVIASARLGDRPGAYELLAEAGTAAKRLGRDANHMWTAFGPTNVRVHEVSAAVELGDAGTAVERARDVHSNDLPSVERRAHHLIDVASGYGQWGKSAEATRLLLVAERVAPEEVRVQPKVRKLVTELLHRERRRIPELRALAGRVGALG
jgi:hypothetical protein